MQAFFLIHLFLFWLLFGSFASVIIHRLKSWKIWILTGRSECWSCKQTLQFFDLIPIFSWLYNKWKCSFCKASISPVYPILEVSTWILFACIWYFLIDISLLLQWNISEIVTLIIWLALSFISIIYIFYDILFLEIHEWVLATWVFVWILWVFLQSIVWVEVFQNFSIHTPASIYNLTQFNNIWSIDTAIWINSLSSSYGLFIDIIWLWILCLTVTGLYTIILKNLDDIWDISIVLSLYLIIYLSNFLLPEYVERSSIIWISSSIGAIAIFTFFYLQILFSWGKWMGQGDLRIAIMVWIILGTSLSFPAMMLTYCAGSIIWIGFLLYQKAIKKGEWDINSQIPFGPFIAIWFFIAIFFQEAILEYMNRYLYF